MISLLKDNISFTPYFFYSIFLREIADEIIQKEDIKLKFVENGDNNLYSSNYRIEPISIPLLLSLFEQLSKFYKSPIKLNLFNNHATKEVLNFLYRSNFFQISQDTILKFDKDYLGDFINKEIRSEHKVRRYSLNDDNLVQKIEQLNLKKDEEIRDFLVSEFVYQVRQHFQELLFENSNTSNKTDYYVELLSELITNGVLHSKSNTFALMFVNNFSTKFSISDNGIGFELSLRSKTASILYSPFKLKSELDKLKLLNINDNYINNLNIVFETLFFSALKDRRGLFDLMISVVLESKGYFRLHSDNAQIIVSNRMNIQLIELSNLRDDLYKIYEDILINSIKDNRYEDQLIKLKNKIMDCFISLYKIVCDKYNNDYRYSSIRFYNVKFKGVHIEVEIPNT